MKDRAKSIGSAGLDLYHVVSEHRVDHCEYCWLFLLIRELFVLYGVLLEDRVLPDRLIYAKEKEGRQIGKVGCCQLDFWDWSLE